MIRKSRMPKEITLDIDKLRIPLIYVVALGVQLVIFTIALTTVTAQTNAKIDYHDKQLSLIQQTLDARAAFGSAYTDRVNKVETRVTALETYIPYIDKNLDRIVKKMDEMDASRNNRR